ncbi:MAG TPA: divalent metal cation transporter [Ktedonosporobacter sp.]|jgi:Mn2+/Fe2+ NRAMP family transporter|nr:divalent metal cation transporter [Ktedonosporobacter sp.]
MKKEPEAFRLDEGWQKTLNTIEPGMIVEAEEGDIGEEDVSKPRVSRIITIALLASLVVALVHLDPIKLLFWANVLSGILAPILMIFLLLLSNNRKVMRDQRLGWLTNFWLVLTILVSAIAIGLLFYGLASGQGSG